MKWAKIGQFQSAFRIDYYLEHKQRKNNASFRVKKYTLREILGYNAINDLIIFQICSPSFSMTAPQIYAPATDAEEEKIDEFYGEAQSEINRTCKKDVVLVVGDWHIKVENIKEIM